jgi:hypothetical protein
MKRVILITMMNRTNLNKIYMNWGKSIIIAFVLFAAFIATLVVVCVRQDISLVSKDYYKEELLYQEQIHRLNNTSELREKPVITIVGSSLRLQFSQFDKVESGELKLFCPSNSEMDKDFKLESRQQSSQIFSLQGLQSGMYRAKLLWKMDGKEFYQEEIINI